MSTITQQEFTFVPMEIGSEEWKEFRRGGLGASDASAALGQSEYKSHLALWWEKRGVGEDFQGNWATERGQALEPVIRKHYANQSGKDIVVPKGVFVNNANPFMRATVDGLIGNDGLLEIKTSQHGIGWGEPNTSEIPDDYMLQIQHVFAVLPHLRYAVVPVSIGGGEPVNYEATPDSELIKLIVSGEKDFWDMVKNGIEPSPVTSEDMKRKFNRPQNTSIVATPEILQTVNKLSCLKESLKLMEKEKESLENIIKPYIANNEVLTDITGDVLVTWKKRAGAERFDAKALKASYPDIHSMFVKKGEDTRTFLVK